MSAAVDRVAELRELLSTPIACACVGPAPKCLCVQRIERWQDELAALERIEWNIPPHRRYGPDRQEAA